MRKTAKLSVIFCLLLSGIIFVSGKSAENETSYEAISLESQSQLYVSKCARCHGANGRGETQLGREMDIPDLTTSGMSSKRMAQVIAKGDGDMPAFAKKLKATQIASLVKYVKNLK